MIEKSELISPVLMEIKKDSRLAMKKLSKTSCRAIHTEDKKDINKNSQDINFHTK